jgi:transcriptional regulator with GAF, ATPase, and Fis domain
VDVNCAALTASLLESELFGHARGSFTGADRDKTGLLELAGAGTVFLDEISEMPLELQAKLLRVLQERTFRKVGGTGDIRCEATIIASSNRPLLHDTRAGRFRMDLYYRLAVFPITLPPLRDPLRRDDIGLLAEYFIANSSITSSAATALSPEAMDRLMEHDWPGNVRELRNVIDRAMILERSAQIAPRNLHIEVVPASVTPEPAPAKVAQAGASAPPAGPASAPDPAWAASPAPSAPSAPHEFAPPPAFKPDSFSLETAEREFILRALQETGWQRTRAAALLGITRATLHAKLKRYDIRPPDGSPADEGQAVPANPSAAALD